MYLQIVLVLKAVYESSKIFIIESIYMTVMEQHIYMQYKNKLTDGSSDEVNRRNLFKQT
jgi:hypothetical protein